MKTTKKRETLLSHLRCTYQNKPPNFLSAQPPLLLNVRTVVICIKGGYIQNLKSYGTTFKYCSLSYRQDDVEN